MHSQFTEDLLRGRYMKVRICVVALCQSCTETEWPYCTPDMTTPVYMITMKSIVFWQFLNNSKPVHAENGALVFKKWILRKRHLIFFFNLIFTDRDQFLNFPERQLGISFFFSSELKKNTKLYRINSIYKSS